MNEQIRVSLRKTGEISARPFLVSEESFVLPAHPTDKILVEAVPDLTECRGIELPKIGVPASKNGIENPRNVETVLRLQGTFNDI